MVRLQSKAMMFLVFLSLFLINTTQVVVSSAGDFQTSQDTTAPNIWDWNYYGNANLSQPYTVWANVSENEGGVGIRNVSIYVLGPNATINETMTFNGTLYEAHMDPLPNPGTFDLFVKAFDLL